MNIYRTGLLEQNTTIASFGVHGNMRVEGSRSPKYYPFLEGRPMLSIKTRWLSLSLALAVLAPISAFAAKKYQVTGKVLELTDSMIVVQKDDDKWEIERNADLKVEGELKVGAKVTIHYRMVADSVESKGGMGRRTRSKQLSPEHGRDARVTIGL